MTERINKLKTFLKNTPNDCFLNHALALEFVKAGDDEMAKTHFEINLVNDPGYLATYYQLAKLFERTGETAKAIRTYETGIEVAKATRDNHTWSELKSALDELIY